MFTFSLTFPFYVRNVYPPADQYVNHADKSHITLVEAFRNMQIEEEEEHLENGVCYFVLCYINNNLNSLLVVVFDC